MSLNTYLFFDGNCREAFDFYKDCLKAESPFLLHSVIRRMAAPPAKKAQAISARRSRISASKKTAFN